LEAAEAEAEAEDAEADTDTETLEAVRCRLECEGAESFASPSCVEAAAAEEEEEEQAVAVARACAAVRFTPPPLAAEWAVTEAAVDLVAVRGGGQSSSMCSFTSFASDCTANRQSITLTQSRARPREMEWRRDEGREYRGQSGGSICEVKNGRVRGKQIGGEQIEAGERVIETQH
jgi:hypothetical protein